MNVTRIILCGSALMAQFSVAMAQPYSYQSASQWQSMPCPPPNPPFAAMPASPNEVSTYQPNQGATAIQPHFDHAGCPNFQHPLGLYPAPPNYSYLQTQTAACVPPNVFGEDCGSCQEAQRPFLNPSSKGFFGGLELIWIKPNFDQNVAMIVDPPIGNTLVPFEYGYQLSPRAWIGWQSCHGSGFRATYFGFDESANSEAVTAVAGATPVYLFIYGAGGNLSRNANANVGQTLVSNHALKLNSLDLEATQLLRWLQYQAIFGLGVRMANMEQTSRGEVFNPGGTLEEAVGNDLDFAGAGPTVSAQFLRGIGASPFGIFAATRASLLVSETEQRIYEMKGAFTTELEDIAFQREVLGNLELGLGLQYGRAIGHSASMFVRTSYECQLWLDAGGPVDSQSTVGLDGITLALGVNF